MNKQELANRVMEIVGERFENTAQAMASELAQRVYDTSRLEDAVAEAFARRWVNENFDKIAAKIDLDLVVKMAQFKAVGKTLRDTP